VRALRFHGPHDLRLEDVPEPAPGPGEVRVRPLAVGVCGTDTHIVEGQFAASPPVVLGHEVAGVVDAVGSGVGSVGEGDLVAIEPHLYCGECRYCRLGREHLCVRKRAFGVHVDGGFAEAQVVPARNAYPLPPRVEPRLGCLAEPLSCCVHAIDRLEPVSGTSALVVGGGPIGWLLLRLCRLSGLEPVVVVEPRAARREAALGGGATAVLDPEAEGWRERALELTGGEGFDGVLVAVGSAAAVETGVELAARGGTVLVVGVARPDAVACISPFDLYARELRLVGSAINPYTQERAVELLPALGLDELEIAEFPLERAGEALAAQSAGGAMKVELLPQA
jgi:2-desacetyl-2-hydroxyethyl bacteriochlorophyllide A dehydrogenase